MRPDLEERRLLGVGIRQEDREPIWRDRIQPFSPNETSVIFVCGAYHSISFQALLERSGLQMPDAAFWLVAVMYSLLTYLNGHQASHRVWVGSGHATLSPLLFFILIVCGWLFHPWLFLIWYGYKTIWWYAVGVLAIGFVFQLLWTKIGIVTGAVKNAWAISLIGIPIIPALFFFMVTLTLWSTETSSLLEVCRRCPL